MFDIKNGVLRKYAGEDKVVEIPEGVTCIGDYAFWDCTKLTEIKISDNVARINRYAFWDCKNLTKIKIPNSVTYIGDSAFRDCKSLTSIRIPDDVTNIGDFAFRGCENLSELSLPYQIHSIGKSAFTYMCPSLKTLHIREGKKTFTILLERMLDDDYWQDLKRAVADNKKLIQETNPVETDGLVERIAALESALSAQQDMINQLNQKIENLTPPRIVTSFYPLTKEELQSLNKTKM